MTRKAVLLLSGGLDSSTCAFEARAQGYEVHALSVSYGQRASRELAAAKKIATIVEAAQHLILPVDLKVWGGSALTDARIEVPTEGVDPTRIPTTYVPARNTILLSLALAWAEVLEAEAIFIGVNHLDYSGYPDCRPEFIQAFQGVVDVATAKTASGGSIKIRTPLQYLNKIQIVKRALELGVPIEITWSCYSNGPEPCGVCDSCRLREEALAAAGVS